MNKRGMSFVDVIVGLILLLTTLLIAFQFFGFLKEHNESHKHSMIIFQLMNNESERAYRDSSWSSIEGNTFDTDKGLAESSFTDYKLTEHHTEHLRLKVVLNDYSEEISIERSIYHDE